VNKARGNYALIVAAGFGLRLGSDMPKQYLTIGRRTLLEICVRKFLQHPSIDGVKVVIANEHEGLYKKAMNGLHLLPHTLGGSTRKESVKNGLEALREYSPAKVLIHDAARPLVSNQLIEDVLQALDNFEAVDVTMPIADTIKSNKDGANALDRDTMYLTQTPQGFIFDKIFKLHRQFEDENFTDDISLAIKGGLEIGLVQGARSNFKITNKEDLEMAKKLLTKDVEIRIGQGFDVHEVKDGNGPIPLCGIMIPANKNVIAHSDGDVALHALMDAVLGALALGDIGDHFPPSDMKWKNADSKDLLKHVKSLMDGNKAKISNIDITILCEEPKIKPYKKQMIECICKILELEENQVSVKATTTEKLGFIGRQEGIAAQAACTLKLY
jgi:2-C-methyl-D-erythritol 4-phosphate cytidylyltransferase/2-C-methyl-D-erythritol 2,4-cyclodiphosphate synthase